MDLGTIIIGVFCLAIFSVPFLLTSRKKKEKLLLLGLNDLAKQQNCVITQHEICGNYAIGIDKSKNFVLFKLVSREEVNEQVVDLSAIKDCKVVNLSRATPNNGKMIERLELHLTPKDRNKRGVVLEFYNDELSNQVNGELQSIEKWSKLINNHGIAKNLA